MKKLVIRLLVVAFVLATGSALALGGGNEPVKGTDVTVSGTVTCSFCKLSHPDTGCHPACCEQCVKGGESPPLTDGDGNQYLLLTGEKGVPLMTPERYASMGNRVTVRGILVKGKGVQAIYVDKWTPDEAKK